MITIAREECSQIPQDFGQDRAQIIPYLIEMVKVSFAVACPTVFIFTYGYYRQRGVLTLMALFKKFDHCGPFPLFMQVVAKIMPYCKEFVRVFE